MKVTVLGAAGFIGGHMVRRLLEDGHEVRAVDICETESWWQTSPDAESVGEADLRDPNVARAAVKGADWVYDLAEDMGGVVWLEANRADGLASFRIVLNVAEACAAEGVERMWFASSACSYNTDLQQTPDVIALREEDAWPARPEKGYGEAKLMGERLCEYYTAEGRLDTRVGRYHAIFGPNGSWRGGREKSPAALARKVAEAVLSGNHEIAVFGDGLQTRSFCFVDDCLEGTLRLMASDYSAPVNIGSSELVTIDQVVDILEDIAGVQLERRYELDAPQGVRGRSSDNALVKQVLDGWEPSIPLRTGLERTYAWIFDQVKQSM